MSSFADRLERERQAAAQAQSAPKPTGDTLEDIENALDAKDIAIAMRKVVAKAVAQRVLDDKMSGGDLVRLLAMLNERVDGKVADKVEHSGSLDLAAVVRSVQAKGTSTGLPKPEWFDAECVRGEVIDAEVVDE